MPEPIVLSWSGGKDSVLALDRLRRDERWNVVGLLTMVTAGDGRVSMHGVPQELIRQQAAGLNLELVLAEVPPWPSNGQYELAFERGLDRFQSLGVRTIAFGDLFLADIRRYREDFCARRELRAVFPLWGSDTAALAGEIVDSGHRAVVCCADARQLTADFVGCGYDAAFLRRLPPGIDLCGERGEFHTLVIEGPGWKTNVEARVGATSRVDHFWYAELEALTVRSESLSARSCGESVHV